MYLKSMKAVPSHSGNLFNNFSKSVNDQGNLYSYFVDTFTCLNFLTMHVLVGLATEEYTMEIEYQYMYHTSLSFYCNNLSLQKIYM